MRRCIPSAPGSVGAAERTAQHGVFGVRVQLRCDTAVGLQHAPQSLAQPTLGFAPGASTSADRSGSRSM